MMWIAFSCLSKGCISIRKINRIEKWLIFCLSIAARCECRCQGSFSLIRWCTTVLTGFIMFDPLKYVFLLKCALSPDNFPKNFQLKSNSFFDTYKRNVYYFRCTHVHCNLRLMSACDCYTFSPPEGIPTLLKNNLIHN